MSSPGRRKIDAVGDLTSVGLALAAARDEVAQRVGQALLNWLDSAGATSLEAELGLSSHGGVSVRTALAIADRDAMLARLLREQSGWRGQPTRHVAQLMVGSFSAYRATRWPRERRSLEAPAAEPAATWWRILQGSARMPAMKRLKQILDREIQEGI